MTKVWFDCTLNGAADARRVAPLVVVPSAWHLRAAFVPVLAASIGTRGVLVVECASTDGLVLAAVRAARRDWSDRRIECFVWTEVGVSPAANGR